MQMIEWAFSEDLPPAEKLVLVYLAANANPVGVGLMNRDALNLATGYMTRSMQRILKSLRDRKVMVAFGAWYRVGPLQAEGLEKQLAELPENMRPLPPGGPNKIRDGEIFPVIDGDAIGKVIADHITDSAEYFSDQLQNFEARFSKEVDRLITQQDPDLVKRTIAVHIWQHFNLGLDNKPDAHAAGAEINWRRWFWDRFGDSLEHYLDAQGLTVDMEKDTEPTDPVIENPLYAQLLDSGMTPERAYSLSETDLSIDADLADAEAAHEAAADTQSYSDDAGGRHDRILDILHGADAEKMGTLATEATWRNLEALENKYTVKGEPDAFELLYPAIVEAAKAHVGRISIEKFIDLKAAAKGDAPWDHDLKPTDSEDPVLLAEISTMLAELEAHNDPRCQVQPRTKETGEDGKIHMETVLGFHRRVAGKYNQLRQLKMMGLI